MTGGSILKKFCKLAKNAIFAVFCNLGQEIIACINADLENFFEYGEISVGTWSENEKKKFLLRNLVQNLRPKTAKNDDFLLMKTIGN